MTSGVTAVIPVFNRAGVVGRAVASVLRQTVAPDQVVVVDDGSTDGSGEVAAAAGAQVVRQENAGAGPARNTGIAMVRSRWVAFLDSDDEWLPHHLERLLELAASSPDAVMVATALVTEPGGHYIGPAGRGRMLLTSPADVLFPTSPFGTDAVMVDRETIVAAGGFPAEVFGEDLDTWIRILERGHAVVTDEVTCRYYEHSGQVSVDNHPLRYARLNLWQRYADRSWATPALERKLRATLDWDDFRHSLRAGERGDAAAALGGLVGTGPIGWVGLGQFLKWRRGLRSHSRQFSNSGLTVQKSCGQ